MLYRSIILCSAFLSFSASGGAASAQPPAQPPAKRTILQTADVAASPAQETLFGTVEIAPEPTTDEKCDLCAAPMLVKRGRFGEFLACSRYPDCKNTRPISLGVSCPKTGCTGFLTEKRSRRGKVFFGCSNYSKTQCDFVSWDRPIPQKCPQCGAAFLVKRENKRIGSRVRCIVDGCGYTEEPKGQEGVESTAGDAA